MDEKDTRLDRIESLLRILLIEDPFFLAETHKNRTYMRELFRGDYFSVGDGVVDDIIERLYQRRRLPMQVRSLNYRMTELTSELHRILLPQSLGADGSLFPINRYIPIAIYSRSDDEMITSSLTKALSAFLEEFSFQFADDFPAQRGSWWKKWFAKTKDAVTQQEVLDRLVKAERAVELAQLQQRQAEADKNQASGTAALIKSLEQTDNACVQAGSILLLKESNSEYGTNIISRTLSQLEMIYLERNPQILKQPDQILKVLDTVKGLPDGKEPT